LASLYEDQVFDGPEIGESADCAPHIAMEQTRCNRRTAHKAARPLPFRSHVGGGGAFLEECSRLRLIRTENQIHGWIALNFRRKSFQPGGF
jgi:hypothetical protein